MTQTATQKLAQIKLEMKKARESLKNLRTEAKNLIADVRNEKKAEREAKRAARLEARAERQRQREEAKAKRLALRQEKLAAKAVGPVGAKAARHAKKPGDVKIIKPSMDAVNEVIVSWAGAKPATA